MERKAFLKKTVIAGLTGAILPTLLQAKNIKQEESTYAKLIEQVGFNHIPNNEDKTMNTVIHRSNTRGHAQHSWLESHHSFSFANYQNPERMNFGVLRVLNDDIVQAGKGFNTHPHDNMEIISIPLEGDLEHKDSMGNVAVIKEGDVQIMSAGTGVYHSEFNKNEDKAVKFLQIWLFPNKKNAEPRYDQISLKGIAQENKFYQVLSPNKDDQGVWINQDAWFNIGAFKAGVSDEYKIQKPGNGVYIFLLEGSIEINGEQLHKRDGIGIWDTSAIKVTATSDANVLLMEVPMNI